LEHSRIVVNFVTVQFASGKTKVTNTDEKITKCRKHYKTDLHSKAEAYPFIIEQETRKITQQPSKLRNLISVGYLYAKNMEVSLSYLKTLPDVCFHSLLFKCV